MRRRRPRRHRVDLDGSSSEDEAGAEVEAVLDLICPELEEPPTSPTSPNVPRPSVPPAPSDSSASVSSNRASTPSTVLSDILDFDVHDFSPARDHLLELLPLVRDVDLLVRNLPAPLSVPLPNRFPRVFSGPPLDLSGTEWEAAEIDAWEREDDGSAGDDVPSIRPLVVRQRLVFPTVAPDFSHAMCPASPDPQLGPLCTRVFNGGPRPFAKVSQSVGRPLPLSPEAQRFLVLFVNSLLSAGIVEPTARGAFLSHPFFVPKLGSGSPRLIIDYSHLTPHLPLPDVHLPNSRLC